MKKLVELFCYVDDFCKVFILQWQKQLIEDGSRQRRRESRMTVSEVMTVIIGFVSLFYKNNFPNLLSYRRFWEVMPSVIGPMRAYFASLKVCHNIRIPRHKPLMV